LILALNRHFWQCAVISRFSSQILIKMTEQKLSQAEKAIEDLADALGITEQEVVSILREGMEAKSPIANQLSRSDEYFISEMEATFGVY
jgi:hypothetical protein